MKPSSEIIKSIYSIGLPTIIEQALTSVMTYLLNVIFVKIEENVVTAYGLRDTITPDVSYNHGMRNKECVKDGIRYGMLYTFGIILIGFAGLEILAQPFAGMFGLSGETKQLCISVIRVISISYVFAGANIAYQGIFQALDSGLESLIVSVCRQFLFVIPVAYVFVQLELKGIGPMWMIWFTFLIAERIKRMIF